MWDLGTSYCEYRLKKTEGTTKNGHLEKLVTLSTQDTGRGQTKQNTTQKLKGRTTRILPKTNGWTQTHAKGKLFLPFIRLPSYYWYHQNARGFDCQHMSYAWLAYFSTDSRHSYGYQLCSSSHRFVPLFEWGSIPTGTTNIERRLSRSFKFMLRFINEVFSLSN